MMRQDLFVPRGKLAVAAVVAGVVVFVLSASQAVYAHITALPDDAVMRVNGREVSVSALDRRIDVLAAIYGVTAPNGGAKLADFRRAAAKSMAVSLVLEHAAKDEGIVIARKTVDDELTKIIDGQPNGDRASFVSFLGEKGLKEADVLDELERTRATQQLYTKVTAKVVPATEADARKEYDSRRDQMTSAERRRLANIVVKTKAEADDVISRLKSGHSFRAIAKSTSLDSSTSDKGGDLGQDVMQSDLETGYGNAAFSAAKGEVFGPVQTDSGWNVGQVVSVKKGKPLSFADVKATLVSALTGQRQLKVWTAWLNDRIDDAGIEYADVFRPKDLHVSSLEAPSGTGQ
ncbi:MAG: PpiC-type peptidyl-prolyl cis-trans isomerase [Aeromicrobium sp.]|nr:PpiC-type peptidyl-prolyl cis-trans isomerase [Ilumatobacteraceae bacterium]MCW2800793.1 PpiC-type peptidyl-prolyl cis-trans isomerase [Aeromicrobium sp.]